MATWEEYKKTMIAEAIIFEDARTGNCEALREYLHHKGDVEARNHRGYSLLMLAAYNDQLEAVELLLENGASINSTDNGGNTILMGAAFKGLKEVVLLLVSKGADVSLQNAHGMTAVDFAKIFGRKEVVAILTQEEPSWLDPVEVAAKIAKKKMQQLVL